MMTYVFRVRVTVWQQGIVQAPKEKFMSLTIPGKRFIDISEPQ